MKIVILSTSSESGGAAIASSRLAISLRSLGQDVKMLTFSGTKVTTFLPERVEIFMRNGFSRKDLFKVSTARFGKSVAEHPDVREADVILLGWINQGFLSLGEIARLGKPVIWTMHDMWCMTGICHHALGCRNFHEQCGNCRFIHGPAHRKNDLSHKIWQKKNGLYKSVPIHFVAVSRWLADQAAASSLLGKMPVHVISNPHPVDDYRAKAGEENIVVMGAARLDDPIKGLDMAIDALNSVYDEGVRCSAEFFGAIRNPNLLRRLRIPYKWRGQIAGDDLRRLYARASVVLNSSHYETSGNTLIEGMAAGAVPVSFNQGGQTDIIEHLHTGYLAKYPDTSDLARGLRWALKSDIQPELLHESAAQKFSADHIGQQYLKIIDRIVNEKK